MLALPLLDFPNGQYILSSNWRLPNGRDGNQHHLFPVEVPSDPTARQGPMLPADHFTSSGLDVQLQVVVGKPAVAKKKEDKTLLSGRLYLTKYVIKRLCGWAVIAAAG